MATVTLTRRVGGLGVDSDVDQRSSDDPVKATSQQRTKTNFMYWHTQRMTSQEPLGAVRKSPPCIPEQASAPEAETSAQPAPAAEGTRENPYPVGSVIDNDEWRVVVNSVTLGATDAVIAGNSFNEPPADGNEYILVNYSVTYLGADPNGQLPAFVSVELSAAIESHVIAIDVVARICGTAGFSTSARVPAIDGACH